MLKHLKKFIQLKLYATFTKEFKHFGKFDWPWTIWHNEKNIFIISFEMYTSVCRYNQVPAIGQRPLFSAPDHSGRRVTFRSAVELSRLAQSDRHVLRLQHQHGFGCRGTEHQLRWNMRHWSVALIGDTVWVFRASRRRVLLPPSTDSRAALLSLTPTVLLATQT